MLNALELYRKYGQQDRAEAVQNQQMMDQQQQREFANNLSLVQMAQQQQARQQAMQQAAQQREQEMAFRRQQMGQTAQLQRDRMSAAAELNRQRIEAQKAGKTGNPIQIKDAYGNVKLYDQSGNLIKDLGNVGAASAGVVKAEAQKKQMLSDLDTAISELGKATADGGLIDKSTGSGAGALVDATARFFGKPTEGGKAVAAMAPIADIVLKMVPRFEGPQSDKDTQSYQEAAGRLSNPNFTNAEKKAAGKEILRLMIQRKNQFVSKDMLANDVPITSQPSQQDQQALEWANANPNDPRAAAIKRKLGIQ